MQVIVMQVTVLQVIDTPVIDMPLVGSAWVSTAKVSMARATRASVSPSPCVRSCHTPRSFAAYLHEGREGNDLPLSRAARPQIRGAALSS
jgi:hypothetical protein